MADLEALHEGPRLSRIRHVHAGRHWGAALGRLCDLGLVTLLEPLPQLLLTSVQVFHLILDGRLASIAAIGGRQSVSGPLATYVLERLVGYVGLRVCRVVEKGVAIDDDILDNHLRLVLWPSILGESFLGLELGIEMTPLTLEAQPLEQYQ